jgi:ABC-type multidrug transport system fused ATPase/permease subunit
VKLSGGERQRVAIARAILKNSPIFILDEATSALDSISEQYIQDAFNEIMKNKTTIVIAHRLSTVQHSDVVYVVEDGAISGAGSFQELRKTVPMVAEYVKLMSFDD